MCATGVNASTFFAAIVLAGASAFATAENPGAPGARIELQVSLCDEPDHIIRALGLRPSGEPLEIWLFDGPALALFERGVRFRLRVGARDAELTLKAATGDCTSLRADALADQGKCEYDVHGERISSAVSLRHNLDSSIAHELVAGRTALPQTLSPVQIRYLDETLHLWPLAKDTRPLGPIEAQSYSTSSSPRYDVDISRLPDGERYVEISRKVPYAQAARSLVALTKALAVAGVTACADQSAQAVNKLRSLLHPASPAPAAKPG